MGALSSIFSAFGLAGAAGLNAYIPLLAIAIAGRMQWITLAAPFDVVTQTWAIALLTVLLVVEFVVDKIPVADHANDVVQSFVRPAAGALAFAAEAGMVSDVPPAVWLVLGLVTALGVHGVKAAARPVVNASTGGLGAPVVSVVEDGVSAFTTLVALVAPFLVLGFALVLGTVLVMLWRRRALPAAPPRPAPVPPP